MAAPPTPPWSPTCTCTLEHARRAARNPQRFGGFVRQVFARLSLSSAVTLAIGEQYALYPVGRRIGAASTSSPTPASDERTCVVAHAWSHMRGRTCVVAHAWSHMRGRTCHNSLAGSQTSRYVTLAPSAGRPIRAVSSFPPTSSTSSVPLAAR